MKKREKRKGVGFGQSKRVNKLEVLSVSLKHILAQ